MRIAVDAMGGDFAPREIVRGAVAALEELKEIEKLYLVGSESAIRTELRRVGADDARVEVVEAPEVVGMGESAAAAVRRKRRSSIVRAVELVKEGRAQALFSAGNTGAAVAATTLRLRPLEGVIRPAIAIVIPTPTTPFVLIDAGATTDCSAELLRQFAVMGAVYSREILGCGDPRVGLLSIGGEEAKGNETTKEAFRILEGSEMNFVGNVEAHDLYEGRVDVAVCDGFVGNVMLKTSEAVASAIGRWLRREFTRTMVRKLGTLLLMRALRNLRERSDPARYGGAPLLGINGVCIIGHGSSSARAVQSALRVTCEAVRHDVGRHIAEALGGESQAKGKQAVSTQ